MKVSIKNASLTGDFEIEFENTAVELKKQDQKNQLELINETVRHAVGLTPFFELLFNKGETPVAAKQTTKRKR